MRGKDFFSFFYSIYELSKHISLYLLTLISQYVFTSEVVDKRACSRLVCVTDGMKWRETCLGGKIARRAPHADNRWRRVTPAVVDIVLAADWLYEIQ